MRLNQYLSFICLHLEMESEVELNWKQSLIEFDVIVENVLRWMIDKHRPSNRTISNYLFKAHVEDR